MAKKIDVLDCSVMREDSLNIRRIILTKICTW
ncbi:hypothetical protein SDC9_57416 [bioreactor metagenome]|uniref:Uncharacterized protein n=1 Tax=bioreactor metagenome TaxID=1076179 RepID=A0A644X5K5_9ZZZZ